MAKSVFGAPVSWFDATPLGRIFNRFSSDIITLDKDLMNDVSSYSDMVRPSSCVRVRVFFFFLKARTIAWSFRQSKKARLVCRPLGKRFP